MPPIRTKYIRRGKFKPKNPERYKGDVKNITYRSSWELKVAQKLDTLPGVEWWSSEEVIVNYINPLNNSPARYYPDFVVRLKDRNGEYQILMIEVKPKRQTVPPKKPSDKVKDQKRLRNYAEAMGVRRINKAKWEAAEKHCRAMGWQFKLMTEDNIL